MQTSAGKSGQPERPASADFHHGSDDLRSLKLYYHQLAESEPLSAEEERSLWNKMEAVCDVICADLFSFAFVFREYIRLLDGCERGILPDEIQASSFPQKGGIRKNAELA